MLSLKIQGRSSTRNATYSSTRRDDRAQGVAATHAAVHLAVVIAGLVDQRIAHRQQPAHGNQQRKQGQDDERNHQQLKHVEVGGDRDEAH